MLDTVINMLYTMNMKTLLIRDVDNVLHHKFKILCTRYKISVTQKIKNLVKEAIDKEEKKRGALQ